MINFFFEGYKSESSSSSEVYCRLIGSNAKTSKSPVFCPLVPLFWSWSISSLTSSCSWFCAVVEADDKTSFVLNLDWFRLKGEFQLTRRFDDQPKFGRGTTKRFVVEEVEIGEVPFLPNPPRAEPGNPAAIPLPHPHLIFPCKPQPCTLPTTLKNFLFLLFWIFLILGFWDLTSFFFSLCW